MNKNNIEKRSFQVDSSVNESGEACIRGHAAVTDSMSEILQGKDKYGRTVQFREKISPNAFDKALANNPNIVLLYNHDANFPLASTEAGNLSVSVDERGLPFDANVVDTTLGRDVKTMISAGLLKHCSFAFSVRSDSWSKPDEDGIYTRTINELEDIFDVSVVTSPAYRSTSVTSLRTLETEAPEQVEIKEETDVVDTPDNEERSVDDESLILALKQAILR